MKNVSLTAALLATLIIGGCSSTDNAGETVHEQSVTLNYSNINDETTQHELATLLLEHNVEKNDVELFMQSVQNYYKSVEGVELLNDSEKLSDLQVPYNQYELTDKWTEHNVDFADQNCRSTAFRLFNDFIISQSERSYKQMDTTHLEMEIAAFQYNPDATFSEADINKFVNFFSTIPVTDRNNIEQSAKEIRAELEKRSISFKADEHISIINGYVSDVENNAVFVGHTGIAIHRNEDVLFIEKYGFGLPYQMTVFKDKEALKAYMRDRLKIGFTGETLSEEPIIMENDQLM